MQYLELQFADYPDMLTGKQIHGAPRHTGSNREALIAALFPEIDSDTAIDLLHNNDEYGLLHQRKGELTERHPFISAVLEGEGPIALSAEEHKILPLY